MKQYYTKHYIKLTAISFIIAFAVLTAYWKTAHYDFINFDDTEYVVKNTHVHQGITIDNIRWAFSFDKEAVFFYWHPFTWLSYMLDAQLFGLNARVGHIMNGVIHGLNAILLFLLFYRMTGAIWKSALVALLFAVHPINVESVVWVSERKNVLCTLFWLLTMHAYTAYARQPDIKKYILILIFFICGSLAKPMLVTLPFVLLLMDIWPLKRLQWPDEEILKTKATRFPFSKFSYQRIIIEKIPLFILSLLSIGISIFSVHSTNQILPENMVPYTLRISNAVVIYIKYMIKLLWPHDMAVFYPFPHHIPFWQIAGAAIILVSITITVILLFKKTPYLAVGWFWYLGTLFPIIGIFQSGKWPEMADRWLYIPEIGFFIMLIWGGAALFNKLHTKKVVVPAVPGIIIIALIMATQNQAEYWKNSKTLFQHTLDVTKNNPVAEFNLGAALADEEKFKEAIPHYKKALLFYPNDAKIYSNMGTALAVTNNLDKAITYFKKAIVLSPEFPDPYLNLANALAQKGNVNKALENYQKALSLASPNEVKNWLDQRLVFQNTIGIALAKNHQMDKAIFHFKQAIALSPDSVRAHYNLANALVKKKDWDAAIKQYKKVLSIDPAYIDAQNRLKKLSAFHDKLEIAKKKIEKQLLAEPNNPNLYYQLGQLYKSLGMQEKALKNFRAAAGLKPNFWEALYEQAIIYAGKKEYDKSIELFKQIISLHSENATTIYYNIACLYSLQNKKTDALDWLKKAIDSGYNNWDQLKKDPDLENIRQTSLYKRLVSVRSSK